MNLLDSLDSHPFWVLYCRAGFEAECLAEARTCLPASSAGGVGEGGGWVWLALPTDQPVPPLTTREMVFARQGFVCLHTLTELSAGDRVAPLLACLTDMPLSAIWVETPDTNAGRSLAPLATSLANHLGQGLRDAGLLQPTAAWRGHVCLTGSHSALVGRAPVEGNLPWPMGIPRLRLAKSAPSRAILKLEEAMQVFLTPTEAAKALRPGLHAVDLGAAPGGWSWWLCQQQLRVTAVDNGDLDPRLSALPLITHLREDGFRYHPRKPVDWLFCDMVEQPSRVAALVSHWAGQRWFRHALFNLKLPMKKRELAVQQARATLQNRLDQLPAPGLLRFKHLYHDREEVTGYLRLDSPFAG